MIARPERPSAIARPASESAKKKSATSAAARARRERVGRQAQLARSAPPSRAREADKRGERGRERGQCQCCCDRGAGEADPVARAPRRSHDRAPRTPELHRSPRKLAGEKEIGDGGGSQSAARAGRSARRSSRGAGGAIARPSSLCPRGRVGPTEQVNAGENESSVRAVAIGGLAKP